MSQAGYSSTPLIKKLGIKPEMKILLIHAPADYFDLLGQNIADQYISKNEVPDIVHLFAKTVAVFNKGIQSVLKFSKMKSKP